MTDTIYTEQCVSDPFFYNEYTCYYIRDISIGNYVVQFWKDLRLVERIRFPFDLLKDRVPNIGDPMPVFWDLFLDAVVNG